jgi:hypothetical protein
MIDSNRDEAGAEQDENAPDAEQRCIGGAIR